VEEILSGRSAGLEAWPDHGATLFCCRKRPTSLATSCRSGEHPERHLRGFVGVLQTGAYGAYNRRCRSDLRPGPIIEALCWSHGRRKFFELADIAANARRGKNAAPTSRSRWRRSAGQTVSRSIVSTMRSRQRAHKGRLQQSRDRTRDGIPSVPRARLNPMPEPAAIRKYALGDRSRGTPPS
jgi:hypothetical protein